MKWLVFSYSLPTKDGSSSRVALWRRLQHLGALEITGLYVLPENLETLEAFAWLSQEVETAGGTSITMQVEKFGTLTDKTLIERFKLERAKAYQGLIEDVKQYQKNNSQLGASERGKMLSKLRRQFDDIARIDFFNSPSQKQVAKMLTKLEQSINTPSLTIKIKSVKQEEYQNKIWVTRPQPYVDRLACIWLIRRFVDPKMIIRYRDQAKSTEVSFDMPNATFGHTGSLCSFETMVTAFALKDSVLAKIADIVHELDLQEGYYIQSESYGIEAILKGWQALKLSDKDLETRGIQLFEGLYQALKEKL